jgi:type IV pilus secretin PilQ/predicted competence protein
MHRYGIVLVTAALAAIGAGDSRLAAATGPRLTAITSTAGVRPAVLIESSEPVAYAAERPDPFTVVVDLRNVSPAGYANGFIADPASPVRGVAVEPARADDGTPVARVKVSLAEPVGHKVRSQRNLIVIELDRDVALSAGATSVIAPSVHTENAAGPAASLLRAIRAEQTNGSSSIVLSGNGRLSAKRVEQAGARRVYLDFPGVSPQVAAVTNIGTDPIDKVRVALNSREPIVTRVVIDLARDAQYHVESAGVDGRDLRVGFTAADKPAKPATVASNTPVASAAPAATADKPVASASAAPAATADKPSAPETAPAPQASAAVAAAAPVAPVTPAAPARVAQTSGSSGKQYSGHPVSLDFQGADLRAVLRTFAEISGLNIVIDPAVQGSVDVSLRDVPWDQALDIILRANKLGYSVDGTIVRVAPLNVLADEEKQRRQLAEQQALAGELKVATITLSYATADQVKNLLLKSALSQRGTIEVDTRSNTLIISDLQASIDKAVSLVNTLDRPQPQVEIEARIVITNKSFKREIGARLGLGGEMSPRLGNTTPLAFPNSVIVGGRTGAPAAVTGAGPEAPNAVNLGVQGATSALGLALGSVNGALNLDLALSALEQQGKLTVISTPRVSTQNNIEAEITQGTQIPIQVVANNTITVQFKDAALKLLVTPQITASNTVIMRINLENAQADFGRSVNGIPPIDTQRAQTTVLIGDGQTTVIGGIYFSSQENRTTRTPVLHNIPLLGWLFKDNLTNNQNNELLIFITPRILKG